MSVTDFFVCFSTLNVCFGALDGDTKPRSGLDDDYTHIPTRTYDIFTL